MLIKRRYYFSYSIVLLWPGFFYLLEILDTKRGLLWFFLKQIYYWPLGSWINEPFFQPDNEIGFFIKPLGCLVTAGFYVLLIFIFSKFHKK